MNYNWDDIELDDTGAHNSRYFFANYHKRCEKRDQKDAEEQQEDELAAGELENCNETANWKMENKENENEENENEENKNEENDASQSSQGSSIYSLGRKLEFENISEDLLYYNTDTKGACCMVKKERDDNATNENETEGNNEVDQISTKMDKIAILQNNENQLSSPNIVRNAKIFTPSKWGGTEIKKEDENETNENETERNNEVDQISTKMDKIAILQTNENQLSSPKLVRNAKIFTPSRWGVKDVPKVESQHPKAFQFHEVYQKKRKEIVRKQLEEEKKKREFHSRPMPNFHAQKQSGPRVHYATVPFTPKVLKRSIESQRKRLEKRQDPKQQENIVPSDNPISSVALQPRPYNLRCERRVQERKKYDEAIQRNLEDKQKQEEERRKQEEEQQIKEIRKATAFKARPNPFRH